MQRVARKDPFPACMMGNSPASWGVILRMQSDDLVPWGRSRGTTEILLVIEHLLTSISTINRLRCYCGCLFWE